MQYLSMQKGYECVAFVSWCCFVSRIWREVQMVGSTSPTSQMPAEQCWWILRRHAGTMHYASKPHHTPYMMTCMRTRSLGQMSIGEARLEAYNVTNNWPCFFCRVDFKTSTKSQKWIQFFYYVSATSFSVLSLIFRITILLSRCFRFFDIPIKILPTIKSSSEIYASIVSIRPRVHLPSHCIYE